MPLQRDVVEVEFRLPSDGRTEKHPVIVLSNEEINNDEEGFVAVMMTSQEHYKDDEYSFDLDNTMFTKPLGTPYSAARVHLIGNFMNSDIIPNRNSGNQMRVEPFKRLLVNINKTTFNLKITKFE